MSAPQDNASRDQLTDAEARRILARAIDLEQSVDSGMMTVMQLRELAQEAGISPVALDAALREAKAASATQSISKSGKLSLWARLNRRVDHEVNRSDLLAVSLAAVLLTWLLMRAATSFARMEGWQAMELTILGTLLAGVGIARRLRARLVSIGLLGLAAFQAAEFAMHTMFGIKTVQGGPTHWAVLISGVLGALLASRFERSSTHERDRSTDETRSQSRNASSAADTIDRTPLEAEHAVDAPRTARGQARFALRST